MLLLILYIIEDLPVPAKPNCLQATLASGVPQRSSQTVPQALLLQISTRPSYIAPPTSLMSPWLQTAIGHNYNNLI